MKKESKLLKEKATNSLLLSIDHFNRPWDVGRLEAVLILLDHSFEMLLKSAILFRGGKIRKPREKNTIGFDDCVRIALSTGEVRFLSDEQALVLQTINGLRDAAQHHLLTLSEGQLYFHTQSGVTLFRDILHEVFNEELSNLLPGRALPVSTVAPTEPLIMFREEVDEIKRLLAPGRRKRAEAEARLRGLAIVDGALQGELLQPGASQLRKLGKHIVAGKSLDEVFPGISAVHFTTEDTGLHVNLRIATKEGIPVTLVPEGTPNATVVGVKRVDELGYYNLGHNQLAQKVGISPSKLTAVVRMSKLKEDSACSKEFKIGRSRHQRYSQNAIARVRECIDIRGLDNIWKEFRALQKSVKK
ncbi:DUF3644 domain-containing protein [Mycobacterium sp. 1245852.3]|uniref:DUF3644 domain-containing protein n=1 Tax=Mycobacterium sp. 1245852.3 TaxID=1856860 RepID=UPI0007FBF964|nr:DUF3644 domain-containing protein [Mycobacterium sp. 1245852.3]OBJ84064.1 hypothetical protein A9W96_27330 [Mycobacterium sp. 1245852.3]